MDSVDMPGGIEDVFDDGGDEPAAKDRYILVVDDSPMMRKALVGQLNKMGYDTLEAGDGREALALVDAVSPALILLDVQMPGMGGLDMLKVLRASPGGSAIPVIMLTVDAAPANVRAAVHAQVKDYLVKPTNSQELRKRVQKYLP
ncbi:MAG: CheY-like chemotaxis protein [Planctomycetota bacterium]|jgi:CheY-like chemotaxis protein